MEEHTVNIQLELKSHQIFKMLSDNPVNTTSSSELLRRRFWCLWFMDLLSFVPSKMVYTFFYKKPNIYFQKFLSLT